MLPEQLHFICVSLWYHLYVLSFISSYGISHWMMLRLTDHHIVYHISTLILSDLNSHSQYWSFVPRYICTFTAFFIGSYVAGAGCMAEYNWLLMDQVAIKRHDHLCQLKVGEQPVLKHGRKVVLTLSVRRSSPRRPKLGTLKYVGLRYDSLNGYTKVRGPSPRRPDYMTSYFWAQYFGGHYFQ